MKVFIPPTDFAMTPWLGKYLTKLWNMDCRL